MLVNFSALAPANSSTFCLFLMNMKVGMLEMLYSMAISSQSSTSTCNNKKNIQNYVISFEFLYFSSNRSAKAYLDNDNFVSIVLGEFFQFGGNHFAGTTPGGKEIDYNQFITSIFQLLIEIRLKIKKRYKSITYYVAKKKLMSCADY